jgi:hypothetical protein
MWLPEISTEMSDRLYQHARDRPIDAPTVADHHGWQGAPQKQVNLGSVTDPITGEEIPFIPRRSHVPRDWVINMPHLNDFEIYWSHTSRPIKTKRIPEAGCQCGVIVPGNC